MAKGWFRDLLIPMKPTESTPPTTTTTTSREWVISFRETFFIPLLRLYLFFFLLFCLDYFLPFDLREVFWSGYFSYILLRVFDALPTLKKLVIYVKNRGEPLKRECMSESILSRDDAETPSLAFLAHISVHISVHMGIIHLSFSLPSPCHFITSFDPPLFVLDGLLFSYYCLIGLSLHLSVQILKKIMKPMLNTLAISLKNKGIISVSLKFESGKNREQKPLVDFDSTNNRACQNGLLVSNSDKTNAREASKGPCMTEGVRSLVDSTTRISSTDFDAPDNSAHLVRANQSGPIMLNSEKNDTSEGLIRECLTESVLSLDDSTKRKSFPDFDAAENKAHLVRPYQSGPVVSLSENKNEGEALKKDLQQHCGGRSDAAAKSFRAICDPGLHATDSLTWKSFKVRETLRPREQQSNATNTDQERQIQTQMCNELSDARGGRPDAAAKSFCAIYDPGFHTPYSVTRKSFDVLETLPARKQPNDGVPLLLPGRLTLEGCVQQEKSPDLPRVMQFNGVEQRVTKMPRYLGGLTAQMIKHVLTSSKIKVNAKNKSGRTALDIHFNTGNPSDTEIQDILIEAGAKRREPASVVEVERLEPSWQTKRRNTRMIVGSLIAIATMAFQVLLPTGLVWLDNLKGPGGHVAGEAIIAYNSPHQYRGFMYLTTVGFLVSLSTIVMLIFALKNKGIISVSSKFESGKNREQKPLVDFDSTNNRACQSGLLVSNSDKTTAREASKGPCMTEGVFAPYP